MVSLTLFYAIGPFGGKYEKDKKRQEAITYIWHIFKSPNLGSLFDLFFYFLLLMI